jgi:hypothetical protein
MAKYSQKMMGKEVGSAAVYAEPHTMTGKKVKIQPAGPADNAKNLRDTPVSVANSRDGAYKPTKTSGIKIRGTGAATKGVMARGPMG